MKATLLFSAFALGICLTGQAQTNATFNTVQVLGTAQPPSSTPNAGDLLVNKSVWLGQHLLFNNGIGTGAGWMFRNNNNGTLQMLLGGNTQGNVINFTDDGVTFSRRVTIGNVTCPTGATCGGALGINNTTLAVGGTIAAQGKVTVINYGGAWPDYVFRRGYRLRPLAEVARYVQLHQHLPDVPSAAQVQANGVELVEMNAVLLKKVEELTLYLVQLQAANQALTERVTRLESAK